MMTAIVNGKVYVERGNFAQALLIEDGIIRLVGTNEEVLAAAPAGTQQYDAQGHTIVPGFNDSHQHLAMVGSMLEDIQLLGASSIREVKRIAREYIAKRQPAPGTVLHGMGWNQDYFTDEHRLLTRQDLDDISTEYPIILERACGHILTANTAALERAGITPRPSRWRAAPLTLTKTGSSPVSSGRMPASRSCPSGRPEPRRASSRPCAQPWPMRRSAVSPRCRPWICVLPIGGRP